jgi:hypothetical protein
MWGTPLLKFNPIEVVGNLSNWMEVTFQHYFDKLLHTIKLVERKAIQFVVLDSLYHL